MDIESPDYFSQTIELVRMDAGAVAGAAPSGPAAGIRQFGRALWRPLFLLLVVAPTALAAIYFYGIAAARYESEAQFVVRSPTTSATNQLSSVVQGDPSSLRSSDDAYIVKEFMQSRDAMDFLEKNAGLRDVFSRPEADILWQYPGLLRRDNSQSLYKHFLRFVSVTYDGTSGIATLLVQAFRPEDARNIADGLIRRSETLINELNDRSTSDAVRAATREVENSQTRAHEALEALRRFREREKIIDPTLSSAAAVETIESLSKTLAETNATMSDVVNVTPNSPWLQPMRQKIVALEQQIQNERQALTGGGASMTPQLAEYESLSLDQTFAEKTFLSALASLEMARMDAQRQRVFLELVVKPSLPDYPVYPYRALWTFVTFVGGLLTWWLARALVANTRSHSEGR